MSPPSDPQFFSELKQLNDDFVQLINETHKKSPYFDFTPTLNDYIRHFNDLNNPTTFKQKARDDVVAPPQPEPNVDKSKETDVKYNQPRSNLFEWGSAAGGSAQVNTAITTSTAPAAPVFAGPLFSFNLNNHKEEPKPSLFSSSIQQATSTINNTQEEHDDDAPPPEPNVDKFEEPDAKYQIRCKLYERGNVAGGSAQVNLIGCGVLFVKQLDSPSKLQVIVRQDPDLRRVLLNEVITPNIPFKKLPKAVQMIVPGSNGQSKFYIAKVKEEKDADELNELLNSIKTQSVA